MSPRCTALSLALLVLAVNTYAGVNTPDGEPPSEPVTVNQKNTSTKAKDRELSRSERKERLRNLPDRYHEFLTTVEPIITPGEVTAFLLLDTDAQRDYFIERFWMIRDPDPATPRNEFRERYEELLVEAKEMFRYMASDRARIYLTYGRPVDIVEIDCSRFVVPIQIWAYPFIEGMGHDVLLIFYEPRLGRDYRLWQPVWGMQQEALKELMSVEGERKGIAEVFYGQGGGMGATRGIRWECRDGDVLLQAIAWGERSRLELQKIFVPPTIDPEHVGRTMRNTVVANPDAPKLPASLEVSFPGRRGTRTAVRLSITVPSAGLLAKDLDGSGFYNLDITGEVLKDGAFFDNYRYRYNFPAEIAGKEIPLVVDRFLRPNDYVSRIKIVDVNSGAEAVIEQEIQVPRVEPSSGLSAEQIETSETIETIRRDYFEGDSRLRIVPLPDGILTGLQKIETIVTGDRIDHVDFYVDEKKIMTKREPPYSLELDLGIVPASRRLRVVGLDREEKLVAGDEIFINTGSDPFRVHIAHPRIAPRVEGQTFVEVEVELPEGKTLDRIDLYLNEDRIGSMFERPYAQTIFVPSVDVGYLRAVAITKGDQPLETEDVVMINTPQFIQEVDVHLIELPTTVLRDGRPVRDLSRDAFQILDAGNQVEIARFEYVRDLPLSVGLAVDSSGSMEDRIVRAQRAAAQFLRDILRSGDRAFVVGFSSIPVVVQKWTDDAEVLVSGLAGLRAEDATALFDSIVYSLYNFQGVKGQKALVVLSDGKDTSSKFTYQQALEYARRAAVPIYSIGIGIPTLERETRGHLNGIARETGGRSYFIEDIAGLDAIYDEIETELRAQYLLGFYPPQSVARGSDWREITVRVDGAEARTIRGYYP